MSDLLKNIISVSIEAGKAILEIYDTGYNVEYKADNSPLTDADKKSNNVICTYLKKKFPTIPLLSEEGTRIAYETRRQWPQFWLIDPLDGTKEFIKRNGEFTVNIALIENGHPVLGVIYLPVKDELYYGAEGFGAFKVINASKYKTGEMKTAAKKLPLKPKEKGVVRVVVSRSHFSTETQAFIEQLKNEYETVETVPAGSSLKLCLVAEGTADVYPRLAPTMEWDIGAGQAIIEASGGRVYFHDSNKNVTYNKKALKNGWFVAKR
jgi:3'(2'), 5'-bisphosphate nucleotidase